MADWLTHATRALVRLTQAVACLVCGLITVLSIVVHANTGHTGGGPLGFVSRMVPAVIAEVRFAFEEDGRAAAAHDLIEADPGLGAWGRGAALWLAGPQRSMLDQLTGAAALARRHIAPEAATAALARVLVAAPTDAASVARIAASLPPAGRLQIARRFANASLIRVIGAEEASRLGLSIRRTPELLHLAGSVAAGRGQVAVAFGYLRQADWLAPADPMIAGDYGTVAGIYAAERGSYELMTVAAKRLRFATARLGNLAPQRFVETLRWLEHCWGIPT